MLGDPLSAHVVVVGGGIVGWCIADEAARRGFRVTVLDAAPAMQRDGCSHGNAGMIVPSHVVPLSAPGAILQALRWMPDPASPFSVKLRADRAFWRWSWLFARSATATHVHRAAPLLRDLHLASRALYEQWAAADDFGFAPRGLLMLCRTQRGLDDALHEAEIARGLGLPVETFAGRGVARYESATDVTCAGGVFYPRDAWLTPSALYDTVRARALARGVTARDATVAHGLRMEGARARAVRTATREDIDADEIVLAAGVWSGDLAHDAGLALPLEAGKGYSVTLDDPPSRPSVCAILHEARVAVTPMGGALRAGGTMELTGRDPRIDPVRVQAILDALPQYYPALPASAFARVTPWAGFRPCSPDGLPYIGRTRRATNLLVATGHAMMGVSLAAVTGALIGELLAGDALSHDLARLSPDRFSH